MSRFCSETSHRVRSASLLVLAAVLAGGTARADDAPAESTPVPQESQPAASPQAPATAPKDDVGHANSEHGSLADVGAKLADPTSNVWALFTEFDLSFSDGDSNTGDPKIGGDMVFQPILPLPLYGVGGKQWKMLNRPTIPVIFSAPIPTGSINSFDHKWGLGDITWPMLLTPPTDMTHNWMLGLGPTWLFPSATPDVFGKNQWGIGPTAIVGYKTKKFVVGAFPQYFFKIGSTGGQNDTPDASFMSLLYFGFLNLPDAWQVGFNPVITYNDKATKGNQWNVPVWLLVTKTVAIAKRPVKFQFGLEYSVVSEDDFGKRFMMKLNVLPVMQSLIKNPIFGGN